LLLNSHPNPSPLNGIRVLDLTEARGLYAGKFLADLGADVIKIEPPEGSASRSIGPFKGDQAALETSLYFVNFNTNKRGITLRLESPRGRDIFMRLLPRSDIVIEDFPVGCMAELGMDYAVLSSINPGLIMVAVSGFGQSGPYSRYRAPDIVSHAMGGLMFISGAAAEPPVVAPCEQAYHASSLISVFSAITALFLRLTTGKGQFIDIAAHDMMSTFSEGVMRYSVNSEIGGRTGSQFMAAPGRIYPCKDGYVHYMIVYPHHWSAILEMMGSPEVLTDKVWFDSNFRLKNLDVIDPFVNEFSLSRTKEEITTMCQDRGIPCTPVNTPEDVAHDPHMAERGFVTELEHGGIGRYQYLTPPYQLSETPASLRRPAPLLGEHNQEIYHDEVGLSAQEIDSLKREGVI
jgi:crotonobetainyl-CoA:carnitine CoA-transferase CaiB-like acyl-CoA transferase